MRSRTPPDLPGRCPNCWILLRYCVCALLPKVANATEVLIVRHEMEAQKSSGTARIAEQVLACVQVLPHSVKAADLACDRPGTCLLYPGGSSATAGGQPSDRVRASSPQRLIVLDGTWAQSRRMLKRMPELAQLPWLSLPRKSPSGRTLRTSPRPEGRATLEAIADALTILEGPEIGEPVLKAYRLFADHVLRARGATRQQ